MVSPKTFVLALCAVNLSAGLAAGIAIDREALDPPAPPPPLAPLAPAAPPFEAGGPAEPLAPSPDAGGRAPDASRSGSERPRRPFDRGDRGDRGERGDRSEHEFRLLVDELGLDDAQSEQVRAIMRSQEEKLHEIRAEIRTHLETLREETWGEIATILTDEQAPAFEELKKRGGASHRGRGGPPPGWGGRPDKRGSRGSRRGGGRRGGGRRDRDGGDLHGPPMPPLPPLPAEPPEGGDDGERRD